MARIYHEKKTSQKIMEGVVAGLIGGAAAAVLVLLFDAVTRGGRWWHTVSLLGSLFSGTPESNAASLNPSLLVGLLIHFLLFALIGAGFAFYRPLFRKFNLALPLAGVIYAGVVSALIVFFFLGPLQPAITNMGSSIALVIAGALGGAAMGWWLQRAGS